mgnify:FL=1
MGPPLQWEKRERLITRIYGLVEEFCRDDSKADILTRLAIARLETLSEDFRLAGHTFAYAMVSSVREVLFDNMISDNWKKSVFCTVAKDWGAKVKPSKRLDEQFFPEAPQLPPATLRTSLRLSLSASLQLLLQLCLFHGCLPGEVDSLLGLKKGETAWFLGRHLTWLGVVSSQGHGDTSDCWPVAYLSFAAPGNRPNCASCCAGVLRLRQFRYLLEPIVSSSARTFAHDFVQDERQKERKRRGRRVKRFKPVLNSILEQRSYGRRLVKKLGLPPFLHAAQRWLDSAFS